MPPVDSISGVASRAMLAAITPFIRARPESRHSGGCVLPSQMQPFADRLRPFRHERLAALPVAPPAARGEVFVPGSHNYKIDARRGDAEQVSCAAGVIVAGDQEHSLDAELL